MILYSKETDSIYDTVIHKDTPSDVVQINDVEKNEHMGNITYENKRRVKHAYPFVFEDIPKPTSEEIAESNRVSAKSTRDNAISENITAYDAEWQVANDAIDIRKVIQDAELINANEDDSVMFRLADNSWRETKLSELRGVLSLHIERKKDVWNQMSLWDSGDKQEQFEVK